MRKREQELLERIKAQQKELETMKQEKTKVKKETSEGFPFHSFLSDFALPRRPVLRRRERR